MTSESMLSILFVVVRCLHPAQSHDRYLQHDLNDRYTTLTNMSPDEGPLQSAMPRFGKGLDELTKCMVHVAVPATRLVALRVTATSTMGALDKIPAEILQMMLQNLDLRSLSRLSQTCTSGQNIVLSLRAYQELLQYVPAAMSALSGTRCISYFSLTQVHEAMCSEKCVSCGIFGAFLSFLTCERCCYECLTKNRSHWVTQPDLARKCFGLNEEQTKHLRILRFPSLFPENDNPQSIDLVSVLSAKLVALDVHDSITTMPDWQSLCTPRAMSARTGSENNENNYLRWIQQTPVHTTDKQSKGFQAEYYIPDDLFSGMAYVPFPTLAHGHLDSGTLCLGCKWLSLGWSEMDSGELKTVLGGLACDTDKAEDMCMELRNRAWTREEFPEHLKTCYGIKRLLAWRKETL